MSVIDFCSHRPALVSMVDVAITLNLQGVGLGESLVPFALILRFQVFCLKLPDIYIKAGLAVLTTGAAARRQGCVYATLSMLGCG